MTSKPRDYHLGRQDRWPSDYGVRDAQEQERRRKSQKPADEARTGTAGNKGHRESYRRGSAGPSGAKGRRSR